MGTPCSKCRPRPPGPVNDFSTAIRRPHGGQHRPAYPGPRPGPILHHCTPSGKWRHPEGSINTDPASGWTKNLPCEGVSETDPAPGWAYPSSRRHLGHLPTSYVTPTSAWWSDIPARPSPPRRGLICRRDPGRDVSRVEHVDGSPCWCSNDRWAAIRFTHALGPAALQREALFPSGPLPPRQCTH